MNFSKVSAAENKRLAHIVHSPRVSLLNEKELSCLSMSNNYLYEIYELILSYFFTALISEAVIEVISLAQLTN